MAKKRKNKNVGLDEETWEIKPECGKGRPIPMEATEPELDADSTPAPRRRDDDDALFALWDAHTSRAFDGLLIGSGWQYVFDDRTGQGLYLSDHGVKLSPNEQRAVALSLLIGCDSDMRHNAVDYVNGDISLDDWHQRQWDEIDNEFILLAALGAGGIDKLTDADYETIAGRVTTPELPGTGLADAQARLAAFRDELIAPVPEARQDSPQQQFGAAGSEGQVIRRAGQYSSPGYSLWTTVQRDAHERMAIAAGLELQELNVMDPTVERHCRTGPFTIGCPECSAAGWMTIGQLPDIGLRSCGPADRCHWAFRIAPKAQP